MLLLAALAVLQQPLPLDVGRRWTFERDGQTAAILEFVDQRMFQDRPARVLRVRGAAIFWHHGGDVLLADTEDGGVQQIGYTFQGETKDETLPLLPRKLEVGASWACDRFDAEVVEQKRLTVPAGTYDAVRVDYVLRNHLGSEHDLRLWIAKDVGIVQFEHWRGSTMGKKHDVEPRVFRLVEAIDLRQHRFVTPPLTEAERAEVRRVITALVKPTQDGSSLTEAEVEALLASLDPIGRAAIPLFAEVARDRATPREQRRLLERAMARFPKLRLTACAKAEIGPGESPELSFRLHNDWVEPLHVLPALDGSDLGRMPGYHLELLDPRGQPVIMEIGRCGNMNPLLASDFRELQPGEAIDPFGPGTFGHFLLAFRPEQPGVYRARLVLDSTGEIPDDWQTELDGPMEEAAEPLLRAMTRGRIVSNQVSFRVR